MFGFVSHQVADITWHSLGIDQGFLRTMGDVNFHGVFSAAHSVGDAGGDMISQFEGDDLVISKSKWYVLSLCYFTCSSLYMFYVKQECRPVLRQADTATAKCGYALPTSNSYYLQLKPDCQ